MVRDVVVGCCTGESWKKDLCRSCVWTQADKDDVKALKGEKNWQMDMEPGNVLMANLEKAHVGSSHGTTTSLQEEKMAKEDSC